jgi:hypothetical protein
VVCLHTNRDGTNHSKIELVQRFFWNEEKMARANIDTAGWTWSAVAVGVIASLVVQVLLVMIGFGVGLVGVDAVSSSQTAVWLGFAWWTFSGIFAAAVGGWVAGVLSPTRDLRLKAIGGLTARAIATLIVVGVSGLAAGTAGTAAGALIGPVATAGESFRTAQSATGGRRQTVGQAAGTTAPSMEEARTQLSAAMLISVVALLLGGLAAYYAGQQSPNRDEVLAG